MTPHRRARSARAAHADDWLITYADTITLLLCLFAVLLSLSMRKDADRKSATQTPAENPTMSAPRQAWTTDLMEGNLPLHGVAHASEPTAEFDEPAVAPAPPAAPRVAAAPALAAPATLATPAPPPATPIAPRRAEISSPEIADRLRSQGTPIIEQQGERVRVVEIGSTAFFAAGSASLSPSGKSILQDVAAKLRAPSFADYQITVEGHTDDAPISSAQFPSNWELSTARAAAVVHFFLDQGLPAARLRAAGYADTFPVAPNRDLDDKPIPENQARNRRVVIRLEKMEQAQDVM